MLLVLWTKLWKFIFSRIVFLDFTFVIEICSFPIFLWLQILLEILLNPKTSLFMDFYSCLVESTILSYMHELKVHSGVHWCKISCYTRKLGCIFEIWHNDLIWWKFILLTGLAGPWGWVFYQNTTWDIIPVIAHLLVATKA